MLSLEGRCLLLCHLYVCPVTKLWGQRLADLSAMLSGPMGISDLTDCMLMMYMLTVVNNLHFQSICHSPILAVCVCSV